MRQNVRSRCLASVSAGRRTVVRHAGTLAQESRDVTTTLDYYVQPASRNTLADHWTQRDNAVCLSVRPSVCDAVHGA